MKSWFYKEIEKMSKKLVALLVASILSIPNIAQSEYIWDLLKQPNFKLAYTKLMRDRQEEYWLKSLRGPTDAVVHQKIEGKAYLLANSCMPHSCNTHNLALAYSPDSKRLFVKLVEEGDTTWLGYPSPAMKNALDIYYEQRFNPKLNGIWP